MELFYEYLFKAFPNYILELFAALAGTYFLRKKPNAIIVNKYLVYLLWYTFVNEVIGMYAVIGYFSEYEYFGFIKNTVFKKSSWMYNLYLIINFSFLMYYFSYFLTNKKSKKFINYVIPVYVIACVFDIFYSGTFFKSYSLFSSIAGSFLLLFSIILFYMDLLKSDKVLFLKDYLPVYISIGLLFFHLCYTPFIIFSKYFKFNNETYRIVSSNFLLVINVFMYTTFIIGFLVCSKNKNTNIELNE